MIVLFFYGTWAGMPALSARVKTVLAADLMDLHGYDFLICVDPR